MNTGLKKAFLKNTTALEKLLISVLAAFNVISLVYSVRIRNALYALSSLMSLALVFLPYLFEHVLSCRISWDLKAVYWFLVIGGPVLGNVYRFYHYIRPWDKLLHMLSGFLAAAVGYALPDFLLKEKPGKMFKCLFAVSLSLAIGGLWEIYEYLLDVFFHMDMQNDTVITGFSSYMLGETPGSIGTIENIETVFINGQPFEKGYIDIGLIDTMKDMIQCLMGSVLCAVTAAVQKPGSRFASIRAV
ncbi:MAG: DUF2238 domain-containing protein [Clostridiales bacterium]|nr:DUF2238 domain-containing protein [Clostridiales bacterium]